MKTTEFLKRKGLVKEGYTHFIIDTDECRFTLNDLLDEYHKEQLELNRSSIQLKVVKGESFIGFIKQFVKIEEKGNTLFYKDNTFYKIQAIEKMYNETH